MTTRNIIWSIFIGIILSSNAGFAATTTRVSVNTLGQEGNYHSWAWITIAANGRFVAFGSGATNLVADDTNQETDVFMHDRQSGETSRVSVNGLGQEVIQNSAGHAISAEGRFVAFYSGAHNMVPNDTNRFYDVFLHDRDRDIVNERVTFEPKANTFKMAPRGRDCADGFVGRLLFDALLENRSDVEVKRLHMPVAKLTGGDKLVTESGLIGPNGEFPIPQGDDYSDGILGPGESVEVPLSVCLQKRKPFRLYVDVADDRKSKSPETAKAQTEFRLIVGLDGDDTLKGTKSDDMIIGFDGNDTVRGKKGDDLILGGRGNDDLSGGKGDDEIRGGSGQDVLHGDGGDDELRGNSGDDKLRGNEDDDLLAGGSGNDSLDGGRNVDICKGGSGKNTKRRCEL